MDNYAFHQEAWESFCKENKIDFGVVFRSKVFGGTNRDHLEIFFNRKLSQAEVDRYEAEKESKYRALYADHIRPVRGLVSFLKQLAESGIPIALATSSPRINVDFVLAGTGTADFFKVILDASHVSRGKPDPEVYLKAASALGRKPEECIVFEDSVNGIRSAQRAGMKVIALATTHPPEELPEVDRIISDFNDLDIGALENLL